MKAHGLSIDTNEDREEGRRILRGLMLREKAPSRSGQLDIGCRYTEDEKRWLKDNWGNEFHFLRAYGLSKDRAAGRKLVRAFMQDEAEAERKLYPCCVKFLRARRWIDLLPMQQTGSLSVRPCCRRRCVITEKTLSASTHTWAL